jgi:protein O-mannosyl-transferase
MKRRLFLVCAGLAILTIVVYGSLKDCRFIDLDDVRYVSENAYVQSGLNANSIAHAFSSELVEKTGNWHPLTWLSLMLDYQVFGLNPLGFHLTNLLFHVVNTLLLFLILYRITKRFWSCAFVAALFAIHPLHVESVAWIAERKDVLSAFFWMLTMGAYSYYVERPKVRRYFCVLVFFILGLMAKPMLVTLPFVLLLLDYWPLQRFRKIWEKAPLFALVIISSIVTYLAQQKGSALSSMEALPLGVRIGNAFISYSTYIWKAILPSRLAVFYPQTGVLVSWQVWISAALIIGITIAVIRKAKKAPYLVTGWAWYLGALVPVIGIVQVGSQSMADRYTYIPLIGIFIMIAWGVPDLLKRWNFRKEWYVASSMSILLCLSVVAWRQVGYWQNSITLFDHTLKVTDRNWLIYNNRGASHSSLGNYRQAIEDFSAAIGIKPDYAESYFNRGTAYSGIGNYGQAIEDYNRAIGIKQNSAEVYVGRGIAYGGMGNYRQAIEDFNKAIAISPEFVNAYGSRGNAFGSLGDYKRAIEDYSEAIRLKADSEESYYNRGTLNAMLGQDPSAIEDFNMAIRLNPTNIKAYNNRGLINIRMGSYEQGLEDFNEAIRIKPDYIDPYINRASVYLKQGNYGPGCRDAQRACELGYCETMEIAKRKGLCR